MKRIFYIVLIILITLPAAAQFDSEMQTMPSASFRSTNTMPGSGSAYSSTPTLSDEGTATCGTPAAAPRRAMMDDDEITIFTPGQGGTQAPIGEPVIPLLLMAIAFAAVIRTKHQYGKNSVIK